MVCAVECVDLLIASSTMTSITLFQIGSEIVLFSLTRGIKMDFMRINKTAKTENNQLELKNRLNEFISFHSNAKQLSKHRNTYVLYET